MYCFSFGRFLEVGAYGSRSGRGGGGVCFDSLQLTDDTDEVPTSEVARHGEWIALW